MSVLDFPDVLPECVEDPLIAVYEEAADLIINDGWWQSGSKNSGHCLMTAIFNIALHSSLPSLYDPLRKRLGVQELGRWNDTPGRTKDEVLAVLYEEIEARRKASRWSF